MNHAMQSYTPVTKPLNYDSLKAATGCEKDSGNDWFGVLAFNSICVFEHSLTSPIFNQPDTVSYSIGPAVQGVEVAIPKTPWSAWKATQGVRLIKNVYPVTPPSDELGDSSGLFSLAATAKVTHAWSNRGMLAIAIEKPNEEFIRLKRYLSKTDSELIQDISFAGRSPALYNAGLVSRGENSGGMVCYYLRSSHPNVIFGRFEADNYAVEHIVMPDLRVVPRRLINAGTSGDQALLFLIDEVGRDVTLTSPHYALTGYDKATIQESFESGTIFLVAVDPGTILEKEIISISFLSGTISDATAEPVPQPTLHKATITLAFSDGDIIRIDE